MKGLLKESVNNTFSSCLGFLRCLTLIVRVSTQHHIVRSCLLALDIERGDSTPQCGVAAAVMLFYSTYLDSTDLCHAVGHFLNSKTFHFSNLHPGLIHSNLLEVVKVLACALPCRRVSPALRHRFSRSHCVHRPEPQRPQRRQPPI